MTITHVEVKLDNEIYLTATPSVDTLEVAMKRLFPDVQIDPFAGDAGFEDRPIWKASDLMVHLVYERDLLSEKRKRKRRKNN